MRWGFYCLKWRMSFQKSIPNNWYRIIKSVFTWVLFMPTELNIFSIKAGGTHVFLWRLLMLSSSVFTGKKEVSLDLLWLSLLTKVSNKHMHWIWYNGCAEICKNWGFLRNVEDGILKKIQINYFYVDQYDRTKTHNKWDLASVLASFVCQFDTC